MSGEPFGSKDYQSKPFYQVWIDALTKPSVENYQQIVNDPKASLGSAVLWLAGVSFINSLISGALRSVFDNVPDLLADYGWEGFAPRTSFLGIIGGAFAAIFIVPIVSLILTGLIHLVSRALGGTGSFEKFFFGFAAFWVPLSLINSIIGGIPVIGCVSFAILIYALVLSVIANQAVHEYDTWKAVVSSVGVMLLVFLILFACIIILVIMGLTTVGPIFENIVNQINMLMLI